MSYKRLNEAEGYGSITTKELLADLSGVEVNDANDVEDLEFRKSGRPAITIFKYCGATGCLIALVLSWVTMAEKIQSLEVDYPHPYLLVYWVHSFYSLVYVVWKIWRIFPGHYKCNSSGDGLVTPRKMFFVSGYMSLISLISAYFWYLSLPRTSVAVNTSIYQSSSASVFLLAIILLGESVTLVKVISLVMSVCGVCLVGFFSTRNESNDNSTPESNITEPIYVNYSVGNSASQHNETSGTALGIVYLLLSMVTYALLEVSAKKWLVPVGDTAPIANSIRGLGLMGVHTLIWMWPPIFILHYAGVEVFSWPSRHMLQLMVFSAFLDITFNASLLVCISLVNPLFASVGAILAIPTAMLWDYLTKHYVESNLAYIGTALIVVGFVGFVISEVTAERRKHKHKLVDSQDSAFFKKPSFGWI